RWRSIAAAEIWRRLAARAPPPDRSCWVFVRLEHQQVRAVRERIPMRLDLHADLDLLGGTVNEVGDEVHADVERHARDRVRLGAVKYRWAAMRDGVREHHALAGDFAPFEVAPLAGEDAHRAREVLILSGGLAVLDDQLLLPGALPIGLREIEVFNRALDTEGVVECFRHGRLAYSGTRTRAALEPQLRP